MWAQLGMAALKSLQDEQNKKENIASNVITQKYAPWTGQRADFSAIGKNNTLSNFASGAMAGYMQNKQDTRDAQELADTQAKLAPAAPAPAAPASSGLMRQPAVAPAGTQSSAFTQPSAMPSTFESLMMPQQQQIPMAPQENPFLAMAKNYQAPVSRAPAVEAEPMTPFVDPTQAGRSTFASFLNRLTPANAPYKGGR